MKLLNPDDFEPWIGKPVRVNTEPYPIEVTLARIWRKPVRLGDLREQFVLFFEAAPEIFLLDTTYEFDCGRGGPHAIHISQLQPRPDKRHYQAVFA